MGEAPTINCTTLTVELFASKVSLSHLAALKKSGREDENWSSVFSGQLKESGCVFSTFSILNTSIVATTSLSPI